ncbi:MAG: dual specificity protein phosphatase family protein [Parcubacteria group bacterium]
MTELLPNLYVGNLADYQATKKAAKPGEWAYVHAKQSVRPSGKRAHSDYLMLQDKNDLYLSWLDTGPGLFTTVLDFIEARLATHKVLVHCDVGESRSPTIALLYLAKRARVISDATYDQARAEFAKFYPGYYPSGIRVFVRVNWDKIR